VTAGPGGVAATMGGGVGLGVFVVVVTHPVRTIPTIAVDIFVKFLIFFSVLICDRRLQEVN
jgi:hypothetical protein